jgi:hypothetical protein
MESSCVDFKLLFSLCFIVFIIGILFFIFALYYISKYVIQYFSLDFNSAIETTQNILKKYGNWNVLELYDMKETQEESSILVVLCKKKNKNKIKFLILHNYKTLSDEVDISGGKDVVKRNVKKTYTLRTLFPFLKQEQREKKQLNFDLHRL